MEFWDHTVTLPLGKGLAKGTLKEITAQAEGCIFMATSTSGATALSLQVQFFRYPEIVDAVSEAGLVGIVAHEPKAPQHADGDGCIVYEPAKPRIGDGFMALFRTAVGNIQSITIKLERRPSNEEMGIAIEVNDLLSTLGNFVTVNHVSFSLQREVEFTDYLG